MAFRSLLCLGLAAWTWPALAAANVVYCSPSQARVDVSRLDIDNGSSCCFPRTTSFSSIRIERCERASAGWCFSPATAPTRA